MLIHLEYIGFCSVNKIKYNSIPSYSEVKWLSCECTISYAVNNWIFLLKFFAQRYKIRFIN